MFTDSLPQTLRVVATRLTSRHAGAQTRWKIWCSRTFEDENDGYGYPRLGKEAEQSKTRVVGVELQSPDHLQTVFRPEFWSERSGGRRGLHNRVALPPSLPHQCPSIPALPSSQQTLNFDQTSTFLLRAVDPFRGPLRVGMDALYCHR